MHQPERAARRIIEAFENDWRCFLWDSDIISLHCHGLCNNYTAFEKGTYNLFKVYRSDGLLRIDVEYELVECHILSSTLQVNNEFAHNYFVDLKKYLVSLKDIKS